jgi:hypothetical protein
MTKSVRKVQPAHKSEKVTVGQAAKAWKKVEASKTANPARAGRSNAAPKSIANNAARTRVAADRSKT